MPLFIPDVSSSALTATVAAGQTTTSTASYADLTTVGPSVTVTIGSSGKAWIAWSLAMSNNTAAAYCLSTYSASGANTIAAADANGVFQFPSSTAGFTFEGGYGKLLTGLTPGSTTFKIMYKVSGGTGTFTRRFLTVIPL